MTIKDFVERFCLMYDIEEDDFTLLDVLYIEDTWSDYCSNGTMPDYMQTN